MNLSNIKYFHTHKKKNRKTPNNTRITTHNSKERKFESQKAQKTKLKLSTKIKKNLIHLMKHYLHIQHKIHKYTDNIHYKGCKLKGRKAKKICMHALWKRFYE